MMKHLYNYILTVFGMLALIVAGSCDVHEFPEEGSGEPDKVPFILNLDFSETLEMGFHKEINYNMTGTSGFQSFAAPASYDVRYSVQAYRVDASGNTATSPDTVITETKSDITDLNHSMVLRLKPGTYKFLVWTDYVAHNSMADLYYRVANFKEVVYTSAEDYVGNNDYRDAFRGEKDAAVTYVANGDGSTPSATVIMERPLAKYKFISTDLEEFLAMVVRRRAGQPSAPLSRQELIDAIKKINLADFRVEFRYTGFMPCSFNVWSNMPNDSWTGITFSSRLTSISESESLMGFDYVLVNGKESSVSVAVYVYDVNGDLLSNSQSIDVPLKRNKLTIVRGRFLTSRASGGVGIVTKFDGEYDYQVN